MASLRITISARYMDRARVEHFTEQEFDQIDAAKPVGIYNVSVPAVISAISQLSLEAPTREAEATGQMAHRHITAPQVRLNRSTIMMIDKEVVRIATRFEGGKERTLQVAPGETNIKPMKVTMPSRWWICDYDKSGALLYYALCTEINEKTGEETDRVQDPFVAQWSYGNSDPGGRICWGQTGIAIKQQSVGEIDDLFFSTPFNSHLVHRPWPKDGDILKDLDNMNGQRLSAVLKGEATIVQPQPRPEARPAARQEDDRINVIIEAGADGRPVFRRVNR